jgi:hypothetical protein
VTAVVLEEEEDNYSPRRYFLIIEIFAWYLMMCVVMKDERFILFLSLRRLLSAVYRKQPCK